MKSGDKDLKKNLFLVSLAIAVVLFLYAKGYCQDRSRNFREQFQSNLVHDLDIAEQIGNCYISMVASSGGVHLLPQKSLERSWRNLVSSEMARITTADLDALFEEVEESIKNSSGNGRVWNPFARKDSSASQLKKIKAQLLLEMNTELEVAASQISLPSPLLLKMYLNSLRLDQLTLSAVPSHLIQTLNSFLVNTVYPQILKIYYLPKLQSSYERAVERFLYGNRKTAGFLEQVEKVMADMDDGGN